MPNAQKHMGWTWSKPPPLQPCRGNTLVWGCHVESLFLVHIMNQGRSQTLFFFIENQCSFPRRSSKKRYMIPETSNFSRSGRKRKTKHQFASKSNLPPFSKFWTHSKSARWVSFAGNLRIIQHGFSSILFSIAVEHCIVISFSFVISKIKSCSRLILTTNMLKGEQFFLMVIGEFGPKWPIHFKRNIVLNPFYKFMFNLSSFLPSMMESKGTISMAMFQTSKFQI